MKRSNLRIYCLADMRIAIFHMNQLGDMMFSLPMIYNLRQNYPNVFICSISKSIFINEFLSLTSLIDKVIQRPDSLSKKLNFINQCIKEKFDLSIHISQSADSTISGFLIGIKERIGFDSALLSFLYTKKVKFSNPPSVMNNFRLIEPLRVKIFKTDYVGLISINPDEDYLKNLGIEKNDFVVVIAPGVSKRRRYKMWPEEKFSTVIKYLCKKYHTKCFIIGSQSDYNICENISIISSMKNVINLAGKTQLKDLCRIFLRTNLFIGVDSGVMHLASSMNLPIVALFGETKPEIVGPQNEKKIIIKKDYTSNITVEEVLSAIENLIKQ